MHTIQALSFLKLAHTSLTRHCPVSQEILTSYSCPELAGPEGWLRFPWELYIVGTCVTGNTLAV